MSLIFGQLKYKRVNSSYFLVELGRVSGQTSSLRDRLERFWTTDFSLQPCKGSRTLLYPNLSQTDWTYLHQGSKSLFAHGNFVQLDLHFEAYSGM